MTGNETMPVVDLTEIGTKLSDEILRIEERIVQIRKKFKYVYFDPSLRDDPEAAWDELRVGESTIQRIGIGLSKTDKGWKLNYVEAGYKKTEPTRPLYVSPLRTAPSNPVLRSFDNWHLLSGVSLTKKARVVPLLPDFVRSMQEQYDNRVDAVNSALSVLTELESQLDNFEKEAT